MRIWMSWPGEHSDFYYIYVIPEDEDALKKAKVVLETAFWAMVVADSHAMRKFGVSWSDEEIKKIFVELLRSGALDGEIVKKVKAQTRVLDEEIRKALEVCKEHADLLFEFENANMVANWNIVPKGRYLYVDVMSYGVEKLGSLLGALLGLSPSIVLASDERWRFLSFVPEWLYEELKAGIILEILVLKK